MVQEIITTAPLEYSRSDEEMFRRQVELYAQDLEERLSQGVLGTAPWTPVLEVGVGNAGPFQYRDVVEDGYGITKYDLLARSVDEERNRPRTVDKASGEQTTIALDTGAEPLGKFCYTPSASETPPRTFSLRLTSGNLTRQMTSGIRKGLRMFWGNSTNTELTEAEVKTFPSQLRTTFLGPRYFASGSSVYRWFAFPVAWGVPEDFIDSGASSIAYQDPVVLQISSAFDVKNDYNTFRSTSTYSAADTLAATALTA
jgi:hypothetical protein